MSELSEAKGRRGFGGWRWMALIASALMGLALAVPAYATGDVVHFGSSIHVGKEDSIHDAVCFFCSVTVDGTARGDVVVFFGDVKVNGHTEKDVVNFFGQVRAGDEASIGHDLVNMFGGVKLGENVRVGQDAVVLFGRLQAATTASVGGDQVIEPAILFWGPCLLVFFLIWALVYQVRASRRRRLLRGYGRL